MTLGKRRNALIVSLSILALIVAWEIAARAVDSAFILPGPIAVLSDAFALAQTQNFGLHVAATARRGLVSFALTLGLGLALGIPAGASRSFDAALRPWMAVIKASPVVSFILLALLWLGSSTVPIAVAALMALPVMTEAVSRGVTSADPRLLEMARVYRLSRRKTLLHVRLPSAVPYIVSGASGSLGLVWKVAIAGEILGSPRFGIGSAMQQAKVHLETARVFALTVVGILLCVATEAAFALALRALSRLRGGEGGLK